jgi:hypothetical protein
MANAKIVIKVTGNQMIGSYPSGIHLVPKKLGTNLDGQILVQVEFLPLSYNKRGAVHFKQ